MTLPEKFNGFQGIDEIDINPLTGSVLFRHRNNSSEIMEFIDKQGIFVIRGKPIRPVSVHNGFSSLYEKFNGSVTSVTNGVTNMGGLAFLVLVGYGIFQISRGNIAGPAWYTAFWYALGIFQKSKNNGKSPGIEA